MKNDDKGGGVFSVSGGVQPLLTVARSEAIRQRLPLSARGPPLPGAMGPMLEI